MPERGEVVTGLSGPRCIFQLAATRAASRILQRRDAGSTFPSRNSSVLRPRRDVRDFVSRPATAAANPRRDDRDRPFGARFHQRLGDRARAGVERRRLEHTHRSVQMIVWRGAAGRESRGSWSGRCRKWPTRGARASTAPPGLRRRGRVRATTAPRGRISLEPPARPAARAPAPRDRSRPVSCPPRVHRTRKVQPSRRR